MREDTITINYEPGDYQISCLCTSYFAVEGLTPEEAGDILQLENKCSLSLTDAKQFLYPKDEEVLSKANLSAIKVLLSYQLNNWVYIVWLLDWFDESEKLLKKLLMHTPQRVNYFSVDPWVAYCSWIIADKGKIIRKFVSDHGDQEEEGASICKEEEIYIKQQAEEQNVDIEEWAKTRQNPILVMEDVFRGVIKASGQHIEELNKHTTSSSQFLVGTIDISQI